MRELENRQKFKRRLHSMPALAFLLVLTVALVKGAYSLVLTERKSAQDADKLAAEVAALTDREKVLREGIDRLQTDEGIEEEIKSKYNVAKSGEMVAVIVDAPESEASTTPEELSWWKRFLSAIIGQ